MKTLAVVLGATLIVSSAVAVHLWRERGLQDDRNRQLAARVSELESTGPAQIAAPATEDAQLSAAVVQGAPDGATNPAAGQQAAASNANSLLAGMQQSLNTPEGREFTRTMTRAMLENQYPDLAQTLGLSAEEAGKFLDLLAQHRVAQGLDRASLQLGNTGDRAAREEMARQLAQMEQAHEGELAAMLGGNYEKWKDYQRAAAERLRAGNARQEADQLRSAVSPRGNPLSDAGFQALSSALAAEQRRIDEDSRGLSMQQQLQRLSESNRRLVDVAAAHLDATQLEGYKQHLEQQTQMARAMMGAMGTTGPAQ
ncbi:MAG TPA: hypothetical protein VMK82_08710 [Steroidobacteraceae bacterium]|nr:hypothetical protein [Steroidobacteraceae bacterium]